MDIKSMRENLENAQEALEGLDSLLDVAANEERRRAKGNSFRMPLAMVQKIVRSGLIDVFQEGDEIWNENSALSEPICWRVIGKNRDGENSLTLWAVGGFDEMPFDEKSEAYPYGHALWRDCSLRRKLNGEIMAGFAPEDAAAIQPVKVTTYAPIPDGGEAIETEDKLWLLSLSQAGFVGDYVRDEGAAYPHLEEDENRQIGDWFRLRSANRSYASNAWCVYAPSGGAYYYHAATYATRPAPACVIR